MRELEYCTEDESKVRLEACKICELFTIVDDKTTKCAGSSCSINMMISFKHKPCPRGNW